MKHMIKICSQSYLMPFLILFALGILVALYLPSISTSIASTKSSYNINLTGIWKGDDGGTYYIRNIGDDVWWLGISNRDDGKTFSNVLRGYIHENNKTITGEWTDIPRGANKYYGTLTLSVDSNNILQKINETSYEGNGNPSCCLVPQNGKDK